MVCVAVQAAVLAGVVGADLYTFDAAAFFSLIFVLASMDFAASYFFDQVFVNAAAMPYVIIGQIDGFCAGLNGYAVAMCDGGKLLCKSIQVISSKGIGMQVLHVFLVLNIIVHKADDAACSVSAQRFCNLSKSLYMVIGRVMIGKDDRVVPPDDAVCAKFVRQLLKYGEDYCFLVWDMAFDIAAIAGERELKIIRIGV